MKRNGYTLVELMIVMAITSIVLGSLIGFAPRWWADLWLSKGAGGVQQEIQAAQAGAALDWTAGPEKAVGVRFLPDPFWPISRLADGTIDLSKPIAYARTVPLVAVDSYRTGLASIHTDGWPDGFVPAWRRLVLEQSPVDADGHRCEPTTWWWLVRVGDVMTVQGRPYTVCGPTLVPPGPNNVEGFVNWGLPGATASPLDRGDGPMEWLYLTNRVDDDGDGFTDSGWDGLDNDLDGYVDEDDEWEAERWINVPPGGLVAAPYTIERRPIAADARSGGDVADDSKTPSPVVVDGARSTLPVNPYTGSVDLVFDRYGVPSSPSIYGKPATLPMGVNALRFTVAARADVATTDPERPWKVVTLGVRDGRVAMEESR